MFEAAEVGNQVDKPTYQAQEPQLRADLLAAQAALAQSPRSVLVIIAGVEGAGKADTINLLHSWMDARGIEVYAPWDVTDEERERPRMWRFWRVLPPAGRIGVMFGSWYTGPIVARSRGESDDLGFQVDLHRIVQLERMLVNEGIVVVKFWLHLSKAGQKQRLKKLEKNPATAWGVTKQSWKLHKKYRPYVVAAEEALRRTSTGFAPWHIVEATDERYRNLAVATTLLRAMQGAVTEGSADPPPAPPAELPVPQPANVLRHLDYSLALPRDEYRQRRDQAAAELGVLARKLHGAGRSLLLVFEGPDAAGKGGAIRRLTEAMDPRNYQVVSVAAPTDEERAHPYLWRFWRRVPRLGRVMIYDRSWYGRVLVERIEGFAREAEWRRAYAEINGFEEELAEAGILLVKFWLAITSDEQLKRFQDRHLKAYKQYKLTEEDWRNRTKWDAYEAAACDMIERTSTASAPWVPVEANDKYWARVKVMETVCDHLRRGLKNGGQP